MKEKSEEEIAKELGIDLDTIAKIGIDLETIEGDYAESFHHYSKKFDKNMIDKRFENEM